MAGLSSPFLCSVCRPEVSRPASCLPFLPSSEEAEPSHCVLCHILSTSQQTPRPHATPRMQKRMSKNAFPIISERNSEHDKYIIPCIVLHNARATRGTVCHHTRGSTVLLEVVHGVGRRRAPPLDHGAGRRDQACTRLSSMPAPEPPVQARARAGLQGTSPS